MKQWQKHLSMLLFGIVWYVFLGYLMYVNWLNLYVGIGCLIVTAFVTIGLNAHWLIKAKRENI